VAPHVGNATDTDEAGTSRRQLSTREAFAGHPGDNRGMSDDTDGTIGRFFALTDVAEVLSLSASEVLELVRSGELPAIRLGSIGQWRVEQRVLESFIADKYDESRRLALWHEAQYADVAELFADRRGQRRTSSN